MISYNPLWKTLIDKNMKKMDLKELAGISNTTLAKLGKNGHVSTEIICKICEALNCGIGDVIEIVHPEEELYNMKKICNRKNKLFCDVILMFAKYVIEKIKEIKTKMCYEIIRKSNECTYEGLRVIEFE